MNEPAILTELLGKTGVAGVLMLAVWYISRKLTETYDARINALEEATKACERDRLELRGMIFKIIPRMDRDKNDGGDS